MRFPRYPGNVECGRWYHAGDFSGIPEMKKKPGVRTGVSGGHASEYHATDVTHDFTLPGPLVIGTFLCSPSGPASVGRPHRCRVTGRAGCYVQLHITNRLLSCVRPSMHDKIDELSRAKAAESYGESNAGDGADGWHRAMPAVCLGMNGRSGLPGIPFPPVIRRPRGLRSGTSGGLRSRWATASPERAG